MKSSNYNMAIFMLLVVILLATNRANAGWKEMDSATNQNLRAIWGTSSSNVFAAGKDGKFSHYNGNSWTELDSGINADFQELWGTSNSEIFAVADNFVWKYDGNNWTKIFAPLSSIGHYGAVICIWGTSGSDVFAAGESKIWHYDGSDWTEMYWNKKMGALAIWSSSSSDVFAVGDKYNGGSVGGIWHYDGNSWSENYSYTYNLYDIWGSSDSDVFAVGESGTILHYDGNSWSRMISGTSRHLRSVWGSSSSDVFVVGFGRGNIYEPSIILHYDGNTWTQMYTDESAENPTHLINLWGSSSSDVFAVGSARFYPATISSKILHYTPENFSLSVDRIGLGSGAILSSPTGINCGTDCSEIFLESTVVRLMAEPDHDSALVGWDAEECQNNDDCFIPIYKDEQVTANFTKKYTINLMVDEGGSVSPSGTVFVNHGSDVTFTIVPDSGFYPEVVVDFVNLGTLYEYTFQNVISDHTMTVNFHTNLENFETGDLSQFPWLGAGHGLWKIQDSKVHSGIFAAQSATDIEDSEWSSLSVKLCVYIPMDISFWFKVSSEINYDFFRFEIDSVEKGRWSGEIDWTKASYPVDSGEHTFTWIYAKDENYSKGSDRVWTDDIVFPKASPCKSEGQFYVIPQKNGKKSIIYLDL